MTIQTFRDIKAWQKSHELALCVYAITEQFPQSEIYGLRSQMRRCAVSVPSNVAEGFRRRTKRDSLNFYNIAQGSLEELKYQLLLSKDLTFISDEKYSTASALAEETSKLLSGWVRVQK